MLTSTQSFPTKKKTTALDALKPLQPLKALPAKLPTVPGKSNPYPPPPKPVAATAVDALATTSNKYQEPIPPKVVAPAVATPVAAVDALRSPVPAPTAPTTIPPATLPTSPQVGNLLGQAASQATPETATQATPTNPTTQIPRGERPASYTAPDQGSFVNIDQRISEATANYEWVLKRDTGMTSDQIAALQQQYDAMTGNSMAAIQAKKQIGEKLRRAQEITTSYNQEVSTLRDNYERKGKYEQQINDFNAYVQAELKRQGVQIQDADSVANNPAYKAAIAALQSGKDINEVAAQFKSSLPANYNFQIGAANFIPQKGTIGDVQDTNLPNISKGEQININGTQVNRTDLEKLLSGSGGLANKASQAALDSLIQTLQNGGALTPEQLAQLQSPFNKDSLARQNKATSDALGALSARGYSTNAASVTGGIAEVANEYEGARSKREAELLKENLQAGITGKQTATKGLADLAASERQARIAAASIGSKENIAQAGITSEEKQKQADLQFANDELFQKGTLTKAGLELENNLGKYDLQLSKYKTDAGFDLERARMDLQERLTQSGLNVEAAKLQADNTFKALDAAIQDKRIDSEIQTAIATLEQKAASGDRDAKVQVDALRTEQDLKQQGVSHSLAMFAANLGYEILSGRERMDTEKAIFLMQLDAKLKEQDSNGGIGGFLGKILGTVAGAAAGGIGSGVADWLTDAFSSNGSSGGGVADPGGHWSSNNFRLTTP